MARSGIVLAAGFGSRLAGVSDETSLKPLTPVGGEPLLIRTVRTLGVAGCDQIIIVVGHGAEEVQAAFESAYDGPLEVVFAHNERYDLANGVSVLAARPHLKHSEYVLTMADHVIGDEVMELAKAHELAPGTAVLLVDYKLDAIFDMDDATKVQSLDGRIDKIGKQIPEYDCVDCGVFVGSDALLDAIASFYDAEGDASLSQGVQTLASRGAMHVLDIGDGFWQDVDTPEMLGHAERVLASRHTG